MVSDNGNSCCSKKSFHTNWIAFSFLIDKFDKLDINKLRACLRLLYFSNNWILFIIGLGDGFAISFPFLYQYFVPVALIRAGSSPSRWSCPFLYHFFVPFNLLTAGPFLRCLLSFKSWKIIEGFNYKTHQGQSSIFSWFRETCDTGWFGN